MEPGKRSFNRKSLHHIGSDHNPYEQAISIIGKTLSAFDEDNLIPCFGFGDGSSWYKSWCFSNCLCFQIANLIVFLSCPFFLSASTHDQDVFSFHSDERFCNGFEEVLSRYRDIVPGLRLAGIVFTPLILGSIFNPVQHNSLHLCDRTHFICSYYWDGYDYSWTKWRPISCLANNCRWTGIFNTYFISKRTFICLV